MRIAYCLFAALLIAPVSTPSTPLAAQQATKMPACDGTRNIVRVSTINPGMMPKFLEAVAGQKAWYKKAGTSDEIRVLRIVDMKTGDYSTTEAMTTHTVVDSGQRIPHDAGYDAFVALFKASSTIKSEYFTCQSK